MWQLFNDDWQNVLKKLEPESFDALITDPPYSSGGLHQSTKNQTTSQKYVSSNTKAEYVKHDFEGDNMDQHSWLISTSEWLRQCRTLIKNKGVCAVFIDWRQLPSLIDAMQIAGWIVRGVAIWDKVNARPQKGRLRQQAEFIVWGSKGAMPADRNAPILPGVFRYSQVSAPQKLHQTQKPLELMRDIVKICEKGGKILDPFAGSGSTLEAAELEGYDSVGIETNKYYYSVAKKRLDN